MAEHKKEPQSQDPDKTSIVTGVEEHKAEIEQAQKIPPPQVGKGQNPNVEFLCLEPYHLGTVPVIAQALDNQWLSRTLLAETMKKGKLTTPIEKKLSKQVRTEYVRSLINGKQVVINRAFIYNTREIARDYTHNNPQREAVKVLLKEGTLIPYLLGERSPDYQPVSRTDGGGYTVVDEAYRNWSLLCQEVQMQCVRFSWDDKENWQQVHANLSQRFNRFAAGILAGDMDTYLQDLGLDRSARSLLQQRFKEMVNLCAEFQSQDKLITRNDLYKAFVTAGDNPAQRQYDPDKPFSAEIKQLLDLAYNSNLPDALGGYLLTPADSLPRTALQEWQKAEGRSEPITGEELVKRLQRSVFDLAQTALQGIKSMDVLTLHDVLQIRATDEWNVYAKNLETLLANPLAFADGGIANVFESYKRVVGQMTRLLQQRDVTQVAKWQPFIEIVFNVAGALLTYTFSLEGSKYELAGKISDAVSRVATPVVGKLIIRGKEKKRQADMTNSIDFMKCKMYDARVQWKEIESLVRKLPGFQDTQKAPEQDTPTINYQDIEY